MRDTSLRTPAFASSRHTALFQFSGLIEERIKEGTLRGTEGLPWRMGRENSSTDKLEIPTAAWVSDGKRRNRKLFKLEVTKAGI